MRYVRRITLLRGRVAKWEPAPPGAEPDGREYFWSDDPIFAQMSVEQDETPLLDRYGNRQWELKNGQVTNKTDPLTAEQKAREIERRFRAEYPPDRAQRITEEAQEAQMDGAPESDPVIQAFRAMRGRRRAIQVEVDAL